MCGEGAVTDRTCQKRFARFRTGDFPLGNATWWGRPVDVDSNRDITCEQSTLYHVGDSRHTQNIQINNIIGKNEKVSFVLWKKPYGLLANPTDPSGRVYSCSIPPVFACFKPFFYGLDAKGNTMYHLRLTLSILESLENASPLFPCFACYSWESDARLISVIMICSFCLRSSRLYLSVECAESVFPEMQWACLVC